jgi:hypothetical protein
MGGLRLHRREFTGLTAAGLAGGILGSSVAAAGETAQPWDPDRPRVQSGKPLRVQPVLMYTTFQRREAASWRSWSKINNPQAAAEEAQRIAKELASLTAEAGFPLEVLPLAKVTTAEEAQAVHRADYDVILLYPATGSGSLLTACFPPNPEKDVVLFARHLSGRPTTGMRPSAPDG